MSKYAMFGGLLATSIMSSIAFAGEWSNQAVSGPNLSVAVQGGTVDGDGAGIVSASGSIPVGERYGIQIDTLFGKHGPTEHKGIGGHLFYRDADYLAGLTAMTSEEGDYNFSRYGVETEFYLDDFTFAPAGGLQRGNGNIGNTGFYTVDGSYYMNDNLKFTVGSTGFSSVQAAYAGAEWQPQEQEPFTVFANAGSADEGNAFALAGVRYTFGADNSSLKKRDRTGDPANIVKTAMEYTGSAIQSLSNRFGNVSGNIY